MMYCMEVQGISSFSEMNNFSHLSDVLMSVSFHSYLTFQPRAPNFFLSKTSEWKKHAAKTSFLNACEREHSAKSALSTVAK
eukprot:gene21348-biopygen21632